MLSLRFQWNLASLKGLPQNSKWQTGSQFGSLWWEIAHPTGLIRFFTNKSALITGKSRKLSGQLLLTFDYEGLYICWYIFDQCKDVSFSQFDWQLVNHRPWIWDHLFSHSNTCWFWDQISLLARKLWQYFCYSLFTNPLVYNKHKKHFWALPFLGVRCHLKTAPKSSLFPLHLSNNSAINGRWSY